MTVIRPNSISGVTSITALQNSIEFYKSDGSLSGANIDGISINTAGIITATKFVGTGDLSIADKIIHTGDTNTTIRFPATDTITAETGGSERLRINSDGKVKIGNSGGTPDGKLHIDEIGNGDIVAELTSGSPMFTYRNGTNAWFHAGKHPSDDTFVITQGGTTTATELLRISSTGQLGVSHNLSGTSAYNRLMLHNPHDGSCWIQMTSTASGSAANTDGLAIGMNSSNVGHVWLRENAKMMFATNGTSRMEISAEGYISNSAQPMYSGFGYTGDGSVLQSNIPAIRSSNTNTNIGSHYNTSTGVFTCPVAGKYLCLGNMGRRAAAYNWSGFYLLHNGVTKGQTWFPPAIDNTSNYGLPAAFKGSYFTYAPAVMSAILTCSVNDTIVFGYHNSYSAPLDDSSVYSQIVLLG